MLFAEKDFNYYWSFIQGPFLVFVLWFVASVITAFISINAYNSVFSTVASPLLYLVIFGFVGHVAIADNKDGTPGTAAWAGTLVGILGALVSAAAGLILFYFVPQLYAVQIDAMVASGIAAAQAKTVLSIGVYVGFVVAPIVMGLAGAFIGWISALITKKALQ